MCANYDVIIITESWLCGNILTTEIFGNNYQVFRQDRNYEKLNCTRGGGVLIAPLSSLSAKIIPTNHYLSFEDLWIQVSFTNFNAIIGVAYFPPNSQRISYENFIDTVETLRRDHPNVNFLVFGDFNLPGINWTSEDNFMVPNGYLSAEADVLLENMYYLELQQVNHTNNSNGRILDLIFTDELHDLHINTPEMTLSNIDQHHPALELTFNTKNIPTLKHKAKISVYIFKDANFDELNNFYNSVDWSFIQNVNDIDRVVEQFYALIFNGIDRFVPTKIITHDKYPKWYNSHVKKLISLKNKYYKKYKNSGLLVDYDIYSRIRRECKYHIDMCYLLFITNTEQMIPSNIKYFWAYISSLRKNNAIPALMEYNGIQLTDPQEIADSFADYFESCYSKHSNSVINDTPIYDLTNTISSHQFTLQEVEDKITALDIHKNAGPDGIPPIFLKKCCNSLSGPLCSLFQKSFDNGTFPNTWKTSTLFPIFKSGDKSKIKNYRGVSMLSAIPKVFESIITDELFSCYKHLIVKEQHGFYKGRSTTTNLAVYHDFLINNIEAGYQVDVIYTDLSKAFDSVCHPLLIRKLKAIGILGNYLEWIGSYLEGRCQCVKIGSAVSREISVTSGVPQGSHIGPILFLLFVNDVLSVFSNCQCLIYADDLKFYSVVKSHEDCLKVQTDLNNLVSYCETNFLKLNVDKCKTMRFYKCHNPIIFDYVINNVIFESVTTVSDLGVIFDTELTFNAHIDNIVVKGFRMLGFIRRNSQHVTDTQALKSLYNCLVRSILEYNSIIWYPTHVCHISRIERVQSKFVKYLLWKSHFPYNNIPHPLRLQLAGYVSLERRRDNMMLCFLHKIISGTVDCEDLLRIICFRIYPRSTRSRELFAERLHRTNYGCNAFVDRIVRNYNKNFIDCDIFSIKYETLRNHLYNSII